MKGIKRVHEGKVRLLFKLPLLPFYVVQKRKRENFQYSWGRPRIMRKDNDGYFI